ncbi:MAG: class IV adenylate cyclase, partial [Promethearchaeota archaeon]
MFEVEIKVKITNPEAIREKFQKTKGIHICSLKHEDIYFNMPEGLRDFRKTDEALRIRKSNEIKNNINSKIQTLKYYLSYKGKKLDDSTKTRKEIEIEIKNGKKMKDILKVLGFKELFTVKKERELYEFTYDNHKIEALIDYIPILNQYFIEVEYLTENINRLD